MTEKKSNSGGIILIVLIIIVLLFSIPPYNNPSTTEEYNKLTNYTLNTTTDRYKLESNIYTNCGLYLPNDQNCVKELKTRIFNISRLP